MKDYPLTVGFDRERIVGSIVVTERGAALLEAAKSDLIAGRAVIKPAFLKRINEEPELIEYAICQLPELPSPAVVAAKRRLRGVAEIALFGGMGGGAILLISLYRDQPVYMAVTAAYFFAAGAVAAFFMRWLAE